MTAGRQRYVASFLRPLSEPDDPVKRSVERGGARMTDATIEIDLDFTGSGHVERVEDIATRRDVQIDPIAILFDARCPAGGTAIPHHPNQSQKSGFNQRLRKGQKARSTLMT